ncbi:MAG TPA: alpha/beta hydrolase [Candidatus Binataceae bacterium]|nr:alpha/beta hydrolase [Candidatus Binataceae bacterium]
MPFAKINGIELYYELHGAGPDLVLAHGGGGNHLSWWQNVPELSKYFRCLTFDHRGFGDSRDVGGAGPGAFVEDLRQLLDHLGIARAALVGQSMGGWTVFGFAASFPSRVSALVLCDTTAGLDDPEVIRAQNALRTTLRGGLQQTLARAYAAQFPERDPVRCFLYQQISGLNRDVPGNLIAALGALRYQPAPVVEAGIPAMLIVGEEDALIAPATMELMAKRLPQSHLVRVPQAGHSVYFEQPEKFNRLLVDFLRERVRG